MVDLPDRASLTRLSKAELLAVIEDLHEPGIHISFSGKTGARRLARKVRPRVMRRIKKYSAGPEEEQARNLIVEGDNLQAMATLYRELGKIDLIVTDPPYNTGKDFRYNDRWEEDPNDPGIGELVQENDGARHTKWMRFMWPRLAMAKAMLRPGGVLAICIDHRELFRLGQMLDELFGETNRLAIINWQKTTARRTDNDHVSTSTEYVLVYAKDEEKARTIQSERPDSMNRRYANPDGDPRELWREGNLTARTHSTANDYAIQSPFTGELHYPAGNGAWRHPKRNVKRWLEDWGSAYEERDIGDGRSPALVVLGVIDPAQEPLPEGTVEAAKAVLAAGPWPFVWFGFDGEGRPRVKTYLNDIKKGVVPVTYWADEALDDPLEIGSTSWDYTESGRSSEGVTELNNIVGSGHGFDTVKPLKLMQKLIQLWCPPSGTVLDLFAGSGTTGHAVLSLNEAQDADRRFILIEQGRPEKGDSYARTLLADRLGRVVSGKWANDQGSPLFGGFRFVSLASKVDAEVLLRMERADMIDAVLASHSDDQRKQPVGLITYGDGDWEYLVARNADGEGFFLVWAGADGNTDFTESVYEACSKEAKIAELRPVFHVYARLYLYQTRNVRFYQIPDRILADFGLDLRSEPFTDPDI